MMNRVPPLSSAALVLMCCAGVVTGVSAADAPVLAQELENVRASGKVMTALWTARSDSYTLQLVFPYTGRLTGTRVAPGTTALDPAEVARVQVWLLKADGTQVFSAHGSPPPRPQDLAGPRTISYSINYSFPLAASKEAVAAVVQINDNFYIDRLIPLRD